jgi:hypothetical protein
MIVVVLAALVLVGCGNDRPSSEDWRPDWQRIVDAVPELAMVEGPETTAVCGDTLAFLRGNRADLLPAPDLAIDDAVTIWFEIAEDTFFDCPPQNEQVGSFAEAYAEMGRLEAEIDVVLEMRRDS